MALLGGQASSWPRTTLISPEASGNLQTSGFHHWSSSEKILNWGYISFSLEDCPFFYLPWLYFSRFQIEGILQRKKRQLWATHPDSGPAYYLLIWYMMAGEILLNQPKRRQHTLLSIWRNNTSSSCKLVHSIYDEMYCTTEWLYYCDFSIVLPFQAKLVF